MVKSDDGLECTGPDPHYICEECVEPTILHTITINGGGSFLKEVSNAKGFTSEIGHFACPLFVSGCSCGSVPQELLFKIASHRQGIYNREIGEGQARRGGLLDR